MQGAITGIVNLLKLIPGGVMPGGHIGQSIPTRRQDLPAIVVSAGAIKESPIGIGGMIIVQRDAENQWTEKRGARISGDLLFDIWAADDSKVMQVANAIFLLLEASKNQLREKGFLQFAEKGIGPVEATTVAHQNAAKLTASYSIIYEYIKTVEPDGGGVIREIDVRIGDGFEEEMEIAE